MPPINPNTPIPRPSAHALGRLSQGLTELDLAIRRLRRMDNPREANILTDCLVGLSQHVTWKRSTTNLDETEDQFEAILRHLSRAYLCMSRGTGWQLWEEDARRLRRAMHAFLNARGLLDGNPRPLPPGFDFDNLLTLSGLPPPDVSDDRREVQMTMNLVIR